MKMTRLAKCGGDRTLAIRSFTSASMDPDTGRVKSVSVWLAPGDQESRYRVDMDRGEAMRLRDSLNKWFPDGETYLSPGTTKPDSDTPDPKTLGGGDPITQAMIDRLAWKDGEYHFCVSLCRQAADGLVRDMSRDSVLSYLELQASCALKDGKTSICLALSGAAMILRDDPGWFEAAFTYLVDKRERIAAGA